MVVFKLVALTTSRRQTVLLQKPFGACFDSTEVLIALKIDAAKD